MVGFLEGAGGVLTGGLSLLGNKGFRKGAKNFLTGTPAEYEQVSNLTPEQMQNQGMLEQAAAGRGGGGAFGESADYWRDILSNNPEVFAAFEAPEQRRFNEQTIPDLAEQFAGMGAGGLSSSGFRNAAVGAGTDLSERLAAMRAGLRQNAASSLFNVGQQSLQPHAQYQQTNPGSQGFLSNIANGIGQAIPGAISGGLPGAGMGFAKGALGGGGGQFGGSGPYGNQNKLDINNLPGFK